MLVRLEVASMLLANKNNWLSAILALMIYRIKLIGTQSKVENIPSYNTYYMQTSYVPNKEWNDVLI